MKDGQWTAEPEPYPWPQDSPRSRATALLEDQAGRVWCATAGGGVFFRPPGAPWQSLGSEVPLSHLETLCLEQDEGGVVWIGTRTAGLHEVRPRPVTARYLPASARQHALVTVCITHDASVWGGTDGAGVFRWRGIESTRYGWKEGLTNLQVAALFEDSRTNLWAGSLGGLFRLQDDRFEPVAGPPAFRQPILALFEDRQQQLWIGSRGGLVCLGEGRTRVFGPSDGLPGNDICALAQDREGRLWVAVKSAGLFRQTGERFEPYAPKTWGNETDIHSWKDDGQQARALLCNADGTIWLATQGADLYRLRNERADVWRWRKDGLPSGHHFGMLEDRQGNLWLSSENGIFGLSKELLDRYRRGQSPRLTPWRLTPADGLAYKVCSGLGQPLGRPIARRPAVVCRWPGPSRLRPGGHYPPRFTRLAPHSGGGGGGRYAAHAGQHRPTARQVGRPPIRVSLHRTGYLCIRATPLSGPVGRIGQRLGGRRKPPGRLLQPSGTGRL